MRLILTLSLVASVIASPLFATSDKWPSFWEHAWPETEFSRNNVNSWLGFMSGGPPKDGIPSISDPSFIPVALETRLSTREPVLSVTIGDTTRAYPIRYLMWHEIVNDAIEGTPVAVTFCPLCNSAMVFDRRVSGPSGTTVLDFGVSGMLRHSDMVMFDRQTESWWQQAIGEGIVGRFSGTELKSLASRMQGWGQFVAENPTGEVMDEPSFSRRYGQNPYPNYDSLQRPFLFNGELPPHDVPALMRVVRVGEKAWPMDRLARLAQVTEAGVTLSWSEGQASALDSAILAKGREVGSIRVTDAAGKDLPHDVMFAFAFHAFYPNGEWMLE